MSQLIFPSGFLVVDKPSGWTSFDVVAKLRRVVGVRRIGHLGTLDPLATGVLVVAVGEATKLIEYFMKADKVYEVTAEVGKVSDTYDTEGHVVQVESAPHLTEDRLKALLPQFTGVLSQVPPAHSAIQVDGQRAYQLARSGKSVELPARTVVVHSVELLEVTPSSFRARIACGSGTYIRSWVHDVGQALEMGAVMTALRRLSVGSFTLERAVSPEHDPVVLPVEQVVASWPCRRLDSNEVRDLFHGKTIAAEGAFPEGVPVAGFYEGRLVSVLAREGLRFRVLKNWSASL